ncbi:Uncharacterized protein BP5553_04956 [Venustampulla echinocandica]|uniref:MYND-type domain-containing protein n=1 Tax=Venustampulla echinocandica TaxID=2656787 RepID=A0A370TPS9_9HELO|nr:Uncharacterized protein BP5553_04956 [Venustampulla echinocandica]RDL37523.1 Uncharacterized protein BP5553_04956 [Venustampulla echinocandica]
METPQTPSTAPPSCFTCHKLPAELPQPLKRCAKCQKAFYCSQECQKQDWKNHKRLCAAPSTLNQSSTAPSPSQQSTGPHNPGFEAVNRILGLSNNTYLHDLPEKEAFAQLIDCYRLRVEDDYVFTGDVSMSSLYGGGDPVRPFNRFLDLAESRSGVLPPWWNAEKRQECLRMSVDPHQFSNINCAIEKSDIQEHYKNNAMPMLLRVLGEKIYGKGFM